MDGVLPVLPVIGSGSGWAAFLVLAFYLVRMIVQGKLITSREATFREKRIESLESTNATLLEQNTVLIESTKPWRDLGQALVNRGSE